MTGIESALIIAAGKGTRLESSPPMHKCLARVEGRPLLAWIVEALAAARVCEVHLVVGHRAEVLEATVAGLSLPLPVRFTRCPDWELGNGRSAAQGESVIDAERFLLLMSDHLISAAHVAAVVAASQARPECCVLGTCSPELPDLDLADATKVRVDESAAIIAIGKELDDYNAVDTGVFAMTRELFPALAEAKDAGDFSLTGGNRVLARQRRLIAAAVPSELLWQDVDTPADLAVARRIAPRLQRS